MNLPPELRRLAAQMLSAALARGLDEAGKLTSEIDRRVKHGAKQAERMARGEPPERGRYRPGEDR